MTATRRSAAAAVALASLALALALAPAGAEAQVYVYPRRATQSHVRYDNFNWHYIDIRRDEGAGGLPVWDTGPRLHDAAMSSPFGTGPAWTFQPDDTPRLRPWRLDGQAGTAGAETPAVSLAASAPAPDGAEDAEPGSGGVRLYFYDRESAVARRAAASIAHTYDDLALRFQHVPRATLPYFLYSSYQEFLQTNLFPLQEGVLGVTSTRSLELALPYFGDHARFERVSRHEMAHQFTLHKITSLTGPRESSAQILQQLPLWFIEGLAELYTHDGLDPETDMLVRDLVLNPVPDEDYVLRGFFTERYSFLWTYKMGQARCAFLEETYGAIFVQKLLDNAPRMVRDLEHGGVDGFEGLLTELTGDSPERIDTRFQSWLKQRAFAAFGRATQPPETLRPLPEHVGLVQTLAASPDGNLLLYRSIDTSTGQLALVLVDPRAPEDPEVVVRDDQPGVESLHPVADRNFAVRDDALVYVALDRGRDVLTWQNLRHTLTEPDEPGLPPDVALDLTDRRRFALADAGLVAIESVAIAPAGDRVALIAVDAHGQSDLFVLDPDGDSFTLRRRTHDVFAERGVAWGPDGIVFASDATAHGHFNLFRLDPDAGAPSRLTEEERDHASPTVLTDGRVLFVAWDDTGANLYEATPDGVARRTRFTSGLFDPAPAPQGGLWLLHHAAGRRRPALLPADALLPAAPARAADRGQPTPPPELSLDGAAPYDVLAWDSWQNLSIFALLGASSQGLFGQALAAFSDRLRNHSVIFTLLALGSFDFLDAELAYINQVHRTAWGVGAFQDVLFRLDRTFEAEDLRFTSLERFFGARATVRFPFDRYLHLQGDLAVGGVKRFLAEGTRDQLALLDRVDAWEASNDQLPLRTTLAVALGYNNLRLHPDTGPIAGNSLLLEASTGLHPLDSQAYGALRADAEQLIHITGRTNILLRLGAGHATDSAITPGFFLSSLDTLRGVPFGDPEFLLGRSFVFGTTELQVPLNGLVSIAIFDVEGIAALDAGAVTDDLPDLWDHRSLNGVLGFNFGVGFLVFRLNWAVPFDIGAPLPNHGGWNTNFSLAYRTW